MMWSRILAVLILVGATLWIGSGVLGRTEQPEEATEAAAQPEAQPLFKVAVIDAVVAAPGQVYNAAYEAALPMMNEAQNAVRYSPVFGNQQFRMNYEDTTGQRW
jgi:hypothetical protein